MPFKWYPGERVLTQALPLAAARPDRGGRPAASTSSSRRSSPRTASAIRTRSSGSCTSSARRTSSTARSSASSPSRPRDRALRRKVHGSTGVRSARRGSSSRRRATSRSGSSARPGSRPRCCRTPPQALAYRSDGYGDFVLSVGRLDRAKRIDLLLEALGAEPALEAVIAGDGPDRERLEALARATASNGRVRFAGPRRRATSSPTSTRRCLAVYYAPVDEDFGMVPYEAFLSEKPVVTTTDAGGPLDVVADRRTGLVVEPQRPRRSPPRCACLARARGDARAWGGPGRRVAEQVRGTARSSGCSLNAARREGRLLQPDAARAVGDRGLHRAAPARRCASGSTSRWSSAAAPSRRAAPTSRSTTSATTRRRTAGSSRRCGKRPGVVVLHEFVLHHLVAGLTLGRKDGAGLPRRDGARRGPRRRGCSRTACSTGRIPPLWETRPEDFPLAGEVLDLADGADRPLALRRGRRARGRLRRARSGGSRTRPGPRPTSSRPQIEGAPADRLLRPPEREQADPAAARGVRAAARERTRGSARRPRLAAASTSTGGSRRRACSAPSGARGVRRRGSGSGR